MHSDGLDVPYIPLRLEKVEKDFLDSLEGKVEHILIGRREGGKFSVLGYNKGRMNFVPYEPYVEEREVEEYVMVERKGVTGEVTEQRGRGVYYNDRELLLFFGTVGLYGLVREFSGNQREGFCFVRLKIPDAVGKNQQVGAQFFWKPRPG